MKNYDINKHVKGESLFVDDLTIPQGTLFAHVLDSPVAHARITNLNLTKAESYKGVHAIITSEGIPGANQVGGIIQDETLLAQREVHFIGEPIALVIAASIKTAKKASKLIEIEFEELPIVTDAREAARENLLIMPPKNISSGDVEKAWKDCKYIFEGKVESGGQEHIYLETQGALAVPLEDGGVKIFSSTQSPTAVQRAAARVLGFPMNKIEVEVLRLGGGFGGKEDQATHWAVLAALGTHKTKRPVKLILSRMDDIRMTGKRHPYSSDYKIGFDAKGKILAYEAVYYQNAGACADLSPAILERTLLHATGSYFVPNVNVTGYSCKTNLVPNTAFRGFGGPQAMFVIESALFNSSVQMRIPYEIIQKKNLLKSGDKFYYGQIAGNSNALKCWSSAHRRYNFSGLKKSVKNFNKDNVRYKKGISVMPVCFGISFTSTFLNQASVLVHVYTDGSVGISTAAVEMGQGVNAKLKTIAAKTFSISEDKIKIESTNTTRIANTSPTAASAAADLNGGAMIIACNNIKDRLITFAAENIFSVNKNMISIKEEKVFVENKESEVSWNDLITKAYMNRTNLTAHSFYSTPKIFFDRTINQGKPFAYHAFGTAICIVTLDCLLGVYEIDSVKIVHDLGVSINPIVDLGQIEGGLAQGIGWMTCEDLSFSEKGQLYSNSLSTYKIPDVYSVPKEVQSVFLENSKNSFGPLNSKAIGEPPLMYGIGVYFAILSAVREFRKAESHKFIKAPFTPERVLLTLYPKS